MAEAWVAVPAAVGLLAAGALSPRAAAHRAEDLAPTLAFLAAVLVLGEASARVGLFTWTGRALAARAQGRPTRLLGLTFLAASLTTAVLSLDATVVLLTPAVLAAGAAARVPRAPAAYACGHLANSASLLLPVSNLTNLLAFRAAHIGFGRFAALMVLPWGAAIAVEWLVLRRAFSAQLETSDEPVRAPPAGRPPLVAAAVLGITLAGFAASGPLGIDPAWIAGAGAVVLAVLVHLAPRDLVRAAAPGFLLFVLALALVVDSAQRHGLAHQVARLVPAGSGLLALLGIAGVAALLANLVNNIPATLVLLPALSSPGPVLAALIGVGIGPNLTYAGSLATLLWRRVLRQEGIEPNLRRFLTLGALTAPPAILLGTLALWLALGSPA